MRAIKLRPGDVENAYEGQQFDSKSWNHEILYFCVPHQKMHDRGVPLVSRNSPGPYKHDFGGFYVTAAFKPIFGWVL